MLYKYLLSFCVSAIIFLNAQCFKFSQPTTTTSSNAVTFEEYFDSYNSSVWTVKNGWSFPGNRTCFQTGNQSVSGGLLSLTLIDPDAVVDCSGQGAKANTSGEYQNKQNFHYGKYEVRMKPVAESSIISSFFIFSYNPWQEIDIEFLGSNTTYISFNIFYSAVDNNPSESPVWVPLGFDAKDAFHTYAFEWEATSVKWYVDGVLKHTDTTGIPFNPAPIMMNVWSSEYPTWTGPNNVGQPNNPGAYSPPIGTTSAQYDWIKYWASGTY